MKRSNAPPKPIQLDGAELKITKEIDGRTYIIRDGKVFEEYQLTDSVVEIVDEKTRKMVLNY